MRKPSGRRGGGRRPTAGEKAAAAAGRGLHVKVKTARGRRLGSTRWLQRQLNDPFVQAARAKGYRSRAAWKLIELDDRFHLLRPGARVLELGAAPGGWTQVAIERVRAGQAGGGRVVAIDIQEMEPVPGAAVLQLDMRDPDVDEKVRAAAGGTVDVVLSDMAAPATGHKATDHLRVIALCETALDVAETLLAPGGGFVAKVLKGGAEAELLGRIKRLFRAVRHVKPEASRPESAEIYLVATGFRGGEHQEKM